MTHASSRRFVLQAVVALATALGPRGWVLAEEEGLELGPSEPFSFEGLVHRAQELATRPYEAPPRPAPEVVERIDWAVHDDVRFRPERALWGKGPSAFPVTFQPLARGAAKSVRIYAIEAETAREVVFRLDDFLVPPENPARDLPGDAGFAGLAVMETRLDRGWAEAPAWARFLGSSRFWADASAYVARGVALDVGGVAQEDRPDFTAHWLAGAPSPQAPVTVCSLLDGPSLAGAYRFHLSRSEAVVAEVEAHLFLRQNIDRLGIAPLGLRLALSPDREGSSGKGNGLAIWTGEGGRIWRPLSGPISTPPVGIENVNVRGFGFARRAAQPHEDGAFSLVEPEASAWVEPLDGWGQGRVELAELPPGEGPDDAVTYWVALQPAPAGESRTFRYRVHWTEREPMFPPELARVRASAAHEAQAPTPTATFAIDFVGGRLGELASGTAPEPVVSAARGEIVRAGVRLVPEGPARRWRLEFELRAEPGEPIELRAFLRRGDNVLSETWLFHHRMQPV